MLFLWAISGKALLGFGVACPDFFGSYSLQALIPPIGRDSGLSASIRHPFGG
jgi:hypothetical protein